MSSRSLREYNAFRVDHDCRSIISVSGASDLRYALSNAQDPLIIGGGSNILITTDLERDVVLMNIKGVAVEKQDERCAFARAMAGESWVELVDWAVSKDLGGIENLSLIPGKCGAAPMQNIGAYGVELEDVLHEVEWMDISSGETYVYGNKECQFGYRTSIFKESLKGKIAIISIVLRLTKPGFHKLTLDYGAVSGKLNERGIIDPQIQHVSDVIKDIRRSKLPDPGIYPNAGSFFKNPVLAEGKFQEIQNSHPGIPSYLQDDGSIKVPAAWLIESCGWKGKKMGQVGTYEHHALVVVNFGTTDGGDILSFIQAVQSDVLDTFDVLLEPEVNIY